MMNPVEKRSLRAHFRQIRREIPCEKRDVLADRAANRLFELDFYQKSDKILVYVSYQDELGTFPVIRGALGDGKWVYVPRCIPGTAGEICFHRIMDPARDLHGGMYGIPEPDPEAELFPGGAALCIVPGLAFTSSGHRLGYGGGYYDRFLSSFPGESVGYCFQEQIVRELPCEPWDVPLSGVVTPERFYDCFG